MKKRKRKKKAELWFLHWMAVYICDKKVNGLGFYKYDYLCEVSSRMCYGSRNEGKMNREIQCSPTIGALMMVFKQAVCLNVSALSVPRFNVFARLTCHFVGYCHAAAQMFRSAHMPFCWFCHAAAQMFLMCIVNTRYDTKDLTPSQKEISVSFKIFCIFRSENVPTVTVVIPISLPVLSMELINYHARNSDCRAS